jgi:hypothetical protein
MMLGVFNSQAPRTKPVFNIEHLFTINVSTGSLPDVCLSCHGFPSVFSQLIFMRPFQKAKVLSV